MRVRGEEKEEIQGKTCKLFFSCTLMNLSVGCMKPPFSSSSQHSPASRSGRHPGNHHSVCLVVILSVQVCVVNFLQRSSCRGLQCEIRESGASALTLQRLSGKHQPDLRTIQHLHIASPRSSSAALGQTI